LFYYGNKGVRGKGVGKRKEGGRATAKLREKKKISWGTNKAFKDEGASSSTTLRARDWSIKNWGGKGAQRKLSSEFKDVLGRGGETVFGN